MGCLPQTVSCHIFMNNYFTSIHIRLSWQHLRNSCAQQKYVTQMHWGQTDAKKGTTTFNSAHQAKKAVKL